MSTRSRSGGAAPMALSQVPGSPSFRSSAANAIAVIPLLSSDPRTGRDMPGTHSNESFRELWKGLERYQQEHQTGAASDASSSASASAPAPASSSSSSGESDLLVVVPNSNLTRPGDWRYDGTPFKNFHWGHGCQRMRFFDGRPYHSRSAHDRLINHELTRNWIDLCPHRRTAALIGVLNLRDCPDEDTLRRAEQEWKQWAERYSTPPYEVTAHGRDFERDFCVRKLFVFDSFHESNAHLEKALSAMSAAGSLVAFPPAQQENPHLMGLHMNVVMNDLAVTVFRELERRVQQSDEITKGSDGQPLSSQAAKSRFSLLSGGGGASGSKTPSRRDLSGPASSEAPQGSSANLSINHLASVVGPESHLRTTREVPSVPPGKRASVQAKLANVVSKNQQLLLSPEQSAAGKKKLPATKMPLPVKGASTQAQLLTPLDDVWDYAELSPKDAQEMLRREVGRREKFAADLSLLAGSPLDAYERYMKAAELCRSTCPDPLWYASALEGCAAAHIAMAEMGGFGVDQYLESSFKLPEALMASAIVPSEKEAAANTQKQTMPDVVHALCDDALNVLGRHPRLSCFKAELLLKLAWYGAEVEDTHLRCQWGLGEGCYDGGDAPTNTNGNATTPSNPPGPAPPTTGKRRWESASVTQYNFLELKDNVVPRNTLERSRKFTACLHGAVSAGALDPVTRADAALRAASLCLSGLRPTTKPTARERPTDRLRFARKASFFAMVAAEAMSEAAGGEHDGDDRSARLWAHAARLLSPHPNPSSEQPASAIEHTGHYGWAALRTVALHGLALRGMRETSEDAAVRLLVLMSKVASPDESSGSGRKSLALLSKLGNLSSNDTLRGAGGGGSSTGGGSDHNRSSSELDTLSTTGLEASSRSDTDDSSYMRTTGESVVSAARSYVRETRARVAQGQRNNFFSGVVHKDSSLLTVAQSKWVEDDVLPPSSLPMSEMSSDIAPSILAMRSVWAAIRFEQCFSAQKRVVREISSLRNSIPASSLTPEAASAASSTKNPSLPIRITSIVMVGSETHSRLERVKLKPAKRDSEQTGAMATFFNPYAAKKTKAGEETTIVPEEEERYILVRFANDLAIPLEIPRCQLDFGTEQSDRIKAPAISFVIPGRTTNFAVQFPFMVLKTAATTARTDAEASTTPAATGIFDIRGLHVTCLARSFFVPLQQDPHGASDGVAAGPPALPDPQSLYPRRKYQHNRKKECFQESIPSPRIEVVPSQPNLLVSFESSPAPMGEDTVIPAPMADGEKFGLPKLFLSNDSGISGLGKIEELIITATGLPGSPDVLLFDLGGSYKPEAEKKRAGASKKAGPEAKPLSLQATCRGMEKEVLNDKASSRGSSCLELELESTPDMGAHIKACTVTIVLRYRGAAPSSEMEVWRRREIEVRVLRIKGPRVSSMTFRPDLAWDSGYSELCRSYAKREKKARYRHSKVVTEETDLYDPGNSEKEGFVAGRLGKDPGVHVCGDKVVVLVSVANETTAGIVLSSPRGAIGGFEGHSMDSLRVKPGVSAKIPMILPRVDRSQGICEKLSGMTKLVWESEEPTDEGQEPVRTSGTMVPVNRRIRSGFVEIPAACLTTIIDENPTFLSRICKAPCSVSVGIVDVHDFGVVQGVVGKPIVVSVDFRIAEWVPEDVLKETKLSLEFCCARKGSTETDGDFVWCGQIKKSLSSSSGDRSESQNHRARLIFLKDGDYVVSACVSFKRTDVEDDAKELWWAEKAQQVLVKTQKVSQ